METLPVLLLLLLLCGLDWALYSIFDTIRHHSFLQYSFRSEPRPRAPPAPPGSHFFQPLPDLLGVGPQPYDPTPVPGGLCFQASFISVTGSERMEGPTQQRISMP